METDYSCAWCGNCLKENLTVHHIDKNRKNDKYDNKIVLCYNCHTRFHDNNRLHQRKNWAPYAIVDLANSNPKMIKLFLQFLRKICRIDEHRLRVLLYCYANQNIKFLKEYWHKITNIPLEQFIKPYVRQDFDPRKKGRMQYGLIHIRYADKKLFLQIQNWIEEYLEQNLKG